MNAKFCHRENIQLSMVSRESNYYSLVFRNRYSNLASCHHNFGMRILRRDIDINCCNILLILNVTVFDETVEKLHFFVYLEKC